MKNIIASLVLVCILNAGVAETASTEANLAMSATVEGILFADQYAIIPQRVQLASTADYYLPDTPLQIVFSDKVVRPEQQIKALVQGANARLTIEVVGDDPTSEDILFYGSTGVKKEINEITQVTLIKELD